MSVTVDPSAVVLPVHPTTGLRALGFTSRGPIWPIAGAEDGSNAGGDGGGGDNGGQGGGSSEPASAPAAPATNAPADPGKDGSGVPAASQPEAQKVEDLPDWAQKVIRDTRKEAGDHRTKANDAETKHQQVLDGIAKALGVKNDDGEQTPDADKLTADLQASQDTARQRAVELAVYRTASKHDGDPDALLDSRKFADAVKGLDPDADGFGTKVADAIKKAVADNPKLKASQAPAASGAQFTGGSGEGSKQSKSLSDAVAARYR